MKENREWKRTENEIEQRMRENGEWDRTENKNT